MQLVVNEKVILLIHSGFEPFFDQIARATRERSDSRGVPHLSQNRLEEGDQSRVLSFSKDLIHRPAHTESDATLDKEDR